MSRFPTPGHLCSWARFAPGVNESAGKKKGRGGTGHGNRYLGQVLGEAAVAAGRTNTFLGDRYRRLARRRGGAAPRSRSAARSWSSSGTCSPIPMPATATSARTTSVTGPTRNGAPTPMSASSKRSATPSLWLWHRRGGRLGVSRSGDGAWPVILTAGVFVILPLFSSRACPRWSSTRSTTPARSCGCVRARPTPEAVCPRCGGASRRVHAWHLRRLVDLPVAGRSVVIELRVRRLVCQATQCPQRTFREQVPELALRYARRTLRLTAMVGQLAITLAGRAGAARAVRARDVDLALDGVAGADGAADPAGADTDGAQRRRCRAAPRPPLRHRADRRRHPPAGRCAARPQGRHPHHVAARASRRRDRLPRRVGRLRRGHPPGRTRSGAGQRPLAPVARPGRCGGEDRHRPQHLLARRRSRHRRQDRCGRSTSGPGPGTRPCTSCSARAWACSNAPAGWAGR